MFLKITCEKPKAILQKQKLSITKRIASLIIKINSPINFRNLLYSTKRVSLKQKSLKGFKKQPKKSKQRKLIELTISILITVPPPSDNVFMKKKTSLKVP